MKINKNIKESLEEYKPKEDGSSSSYDLYEHFKEREYYQEIKIGYNNWHPNLIIINDKHINICPKKIKNVMKYLNKIISDINNNKL